jgi:hypothetical protein
MNHFADTGAEALTDFQEIFSVPRASLALSIRMVNCSTISGDFSTLQNSSVIRDRCQSLPDQEPIENI